MVVHGTLILDFEIILGRITAICKLKSVKQIDFGGYNFPGLLTV